MLPPLHCTFPVIAPPVQPIPPLTVTHPLPPNIPSLTVNVPTEATVPLLKFIVPPFTSIVPGKLQVPLRFTVPPLLPTVPSPTIRDPASMLCVPPEKSKRPPPIALFVPLLFPPLANARTPLPASTVPVLLNVSFNVDRPVPAVFRHIPELLMVPLGPTLLKDVPASLKISKMPPGALLITDPLPV